MTPERLYSLFAVKYPAREAEMHQLYRQPGALVCVVHSSKGEDSRVLARRAFSLLSTTGWPFWAGRVVCGGSQSKLFKSNLSQERTSFSQFLENHKDNQHALQKGA